MKKFKILKVIASMSVFIFRTVLFKSHKHDVTDPNWLQTKKARMNQRMWEWHTGIKKQ